MIWLIIPAYSFQFLSQRRNIFTYLERRVDKWLVLFSDLTGQTQVSEVCDTRNTTDGNCCAFPFTYREEIYYECTTRDFGQEWCSLKEDYEQHRQWGFCGRSTYFLCVERLTRKCRRTCNFLLPFLQSLEIAGCFSYKIPNIFILVIYSFPLYFGDLEIGQE